MGYLRKVGCRLNMKINSETEQTMPIIYKIHAISDYGQSQASTVNLIYSIALSNMYNQYFS